MVIFTMACAKEQTVEELDATLEEITTLTEEEGTAAAVFECSLDLQFSDKDGNDLLNPETQNCINYEKMKLFYLIKGEKVLISGDSTELYMNLIFHSGTSNELRIITNAEAYSPNTTGVSTTYLEFEDGVTDTIVAEWVYTVSDSIPNGADGGSYIGNKKAWYNGVEMKRDTINQIIK